MKKLEIINNWVKEGSKVLFLGCGSGEIPKVLLPNLFSEFAYFLLKK